MQRYDFFLNRQNFSPFFCKKDKKSIFERRESEKQKGHFKAMKKPYH